jgi:hypothetical protein
MLLGSRPVKIIDPARPGPGSPYVGQYVTARYVAGLRRRAKPVPLRQRIGDPDTNR